MYTSFLQNFHECQININDTLRFCKLSKKKKKKKKTDYKGKQFALICVIAFYQ